MEKANSDWSFGQEFIFIARALSDWSFGQEFIMLEHYIFERTMLVPIKRRDFNGKCL